MTELISRARIQQQAIEAAERGDQPTDCPYVRHSEFERVWKDAFYIRVFQLSGEESA
jgi:hypothetical protein